MAVGDITSANATVIVSVDDLYGAGFELEQFAADSSFAEGEITVAEDRMGVDGQLVAGWIPSIKTVTISLEASSPSYTYLATLYRANEQKRGFYRVSMVISVPSIGKTFTYTDGILKSGTPVPAGKKVLDPTQWVFDFKTLTIVDAA